MEAQYAKELNHYTADRRQCAWKKRGGRKREKKIKWNKKKKGESGSPAPIQTRLGAGTRGYIYVFLTLLYVHRHYTNIQICFFFFRSLWFIFPCVMKSLFIFQSYIFSHSSVQHFFNTSFVHGLHENYENLAMSTPMSLLPHIKKSSNFFFFFEFI